MPSQTTQHKVPYPLSSDTVASNPATELAQATRLDLLLGESGVATTVTGTSGVVTVVLSRTYPGNATLAPQGFVIVNLNATLPATTVFNYWVATWTGTATTVTGFQIGWATSVSMAARSLLWRFIPAAF